MLQEIDRLVRDLTPIFTILAPLITALATFVTALATIITVKVKASKSEKRERRPNQTQARIVKKKP